MKLQEALYEWSVRSLVRALLAESGRTRPAPLQKINDDMVTTALEHLRHFATLTAYPASRHLRVVAAHVQAQARRDDFTVGAATGFFDPVQDVPRLGPILDILEAKLAAMPVPTREEAMAFWDRWHREGTAWERDHDGHRFLSSFWSCGTWRPTGVAIPTAELHDEDGPPGPLSASIHVIPLPGRRITLEVVDHSADHHIEPYDEDTDHIVRRYRTETFVGVDPLFGRGQWATADQGRRWHNTIRCLHWEELARLKEERLEAMVSQVRDDGQLAEWVQLPPDLRRGEALDQFRLRCSADASVMEVLRQLYDLPGYTQTSRELDWAEAADLQAVLTFRAATGHLPGGYDSITTMVVALARSLGLAARPAKYNYWAEIYLPQLEAWAPLDPGRMLLVHPTRSWHRLCGQLLSVPGRTLTVTYEDTAYTGPREPDWMRRPTGC